MYNSYHTFFLNLANRLKIDLVLLLRKKEMSVSKIVNKTGIEQSKISHALSSLRCCNIVLCKKDGKKRIYRLNEKTIVPMLKLIDEHSKEFCKHPYSKCKKIHEIKN